MQDEASNYDEAENSDDFETADEMENDSPVDVPNGHQETDEDSEDEQPLAVQEVAVPDAVQDVVAAVQKAVVSRRQKSVQEASKPTRCSQRLMDRTAKLLQGVRRRSTRRESQIASEKITLCFSKRWVDWDSFVPSTPRKSLRRQVWKRN